MKPAIGTPVIHQGRSAEVSRVLGWWRSADRKHHGAIVALRYPEDVIRGEFRIEYQAERWVIVELKQRKVVANCL